MFPSARYSPRPVAKNPYPSIQLSNISGVTRSLDDWTTTFNLAMVMLPARAEASVWNWVIDRIYATFGDSDVRTTIWVASTPAIARRILGDLADRYLGVLRPRPGARHQHGHRAAAAFVHFRQDTSLVGAAQGWSPIGVAEDGQRDRPPRALDVAGDRHGGRPRGLARAGPSEL